MAQADVEAASLDAARSEIQECSAIREAIEWEYRDSQDVVSY